VIARTITIGTLSTALRTCTAEPHRGTSPYPDPFYIALPDAELIAHLRNQAALARAVIEAAVRLLDTEEWEGTASRDAMDLTLTAWADYVNREDTPQ